MPTFGSAKPFEYDANVDQPEPMRQTAPTLGRLAL